MEVSFPSMKTYVPMALPVAMPMALILVGEALLFEDNLEGCVLIHLLNIMMCVMAPIIMKTNPIIWQSFSLVSMLRVLNLGMPRFATMTVDWMPLVYAPVIIVAFLLIRDEKLGWKDYLLQFRKFFSLSQRAAGWKAYYLPAGLLIALVLANLEFKVLGRSVLDLRLIPDLSLGNLAILLIVMVFFVGLGEELVFRYILQTRLEGVLGVLLAITTSSAVFAFMHSGYQTMPYMSYVFLVGFLLGSLFYVTRSLGLVVLIHGTLNFFLFSFLPFGYLVLF